MADKPPDAFLSYTRFDDQNDGGAISEFRTRLANAVRAVTGEPFEIFQDVDGIALGEHWPGKLDQLLDEARFFIPILTPSYFRSKACREELAKFLRAEEDRRRKDLILPIYYIECRLLEDAGFRASDPLAEAIHQRQRQDWRELRYESFETKDVRKALHQLALGVAGARRRWVASVPAPPANASERAPAEQQSIATRSDSALRDIDEPWCPEMVEVPDGEFMMGSPEGDSEAYDDEKPQHLVRLEYRLLVGRCPVTFEEYDHFCGSTQRRSPGDYDWGRGRRPVIDVSWDDAKAYVEWLAGQSGQPYRLLSEAEWEYACRAGTTTRYWWGEEIAPDHANSGGNVGRTSEVGAYPASPWGLCDMHGNVWEWVEDRWHASYQGAPADGSAWVEGKDSGRVVRGGAWYDDPGVLRAACRGSFGPGYRSFEPGFRVARTLTS